MKVDLKKTPLASFRIGYTACKAKNDRLPKSSSPTNLLWEERRRGNLADEVPCTRRSTRMCCTVVY